MIAAFTSGAAFSLVSSIGGGAAANPMQAATQQNPLMAAFSSGVLFALFQGGIYKVGSCLPYLRADWSRVSSKGGQALLSSCT